jgi:sulfite exporter TauE/SafE
MLAALTMLAFWLGTLPILLPLGFGVQRLRARMGARTAVATALALIAIGLLTISSRMEKFGTAAFGSLAKPANLDESVRDAAAVNSRELPCCRSEGQRR